MSVLFSWSHSLLVLTTAVVRGQLFLIFFVTWVICLGDVMLILLVLTHTRVSLNYLWLIVGIANLLSLLLLWTWRIVWYILLLMLLLLVEDLSDIRTWLVVAETRFTLVVFSLYQNILIPVVLLIRWCAILVFLALAIFECLVVSFTLVMSMMLHHDWLLQCIRIRIVVNHVVSSINWLLLLLRHHHRSLTRV